MFGNVQFLIGGNPRHKKVANRKSSRTLKKKGAHSVRKKRRVKKRSNPQKYKLTKIVDGKKKSITSSFVVPRDYKEWSKRTKSLRSKIKEASSKKRGTKGAVKALAHAEGKLSAISESARMGIAVRNAEKKSGGKVTKVGPYVSPFRKGKKSMAK